MSKARTKLLVLFSAVVAALVMLIVGISSANATNTTYGTPGVDYIEGQAIICIADQDNNLQSTIDELNCTNDAKAAISNYEVLMELNSSTELQNAVANGDSQKIQSLAVSESQVLANNNYSSDSTCKILAVDVSNTQNFLSATSNNSKILWAQPNYIRTATEVGDTNANPNDTMYDYQWSLNASKFWGDTDYDLDYENNYPYSDTEETVVAVLDTGVAYDHPDIPMWDKGLDYPVLCQTLGGGKYGYNGNTEDKDPQPSSDPYDKTSGHGSHCASNIAGITNNKIGTAGINTNTKIMALRFLGDNGGTDIGAIKCYNYMNTAKQAGVNVTTISNSWGSTPYAFNAPALEAVTIQAGMLGVMSVFAAGNDNTSLDGYPNNTYHNPFVVVVGASDSIGRSASFSNYGERMVDVYAPGTSSLCATTAKRGQYLPWVQDDVDDYVYEDFEGTEKATVSASYVDSQGQTVKINPLKTEVEGTSYNNIQYIDFTGAKEGNQFNVVISIPKTSIKEVISSAPYLALMYGFQQMSLQARIEFGYYNAAGEFTNISNYGSYDGTMNVVSYLTDNKLDLTADNIKFGFQGYFDKVGTSPFFWVDNIGLGKKTINYTYMQGTSMACPVVSGVASVVAATTRKHVTAADTLSNIAYVKGCTVTSPYLQGKCQTGGIVNLNNAYTAAKSKNPETILNPVMQDLSVDEASNTATLTGYFFGKDAGSLTIDGNSIKVTSWSDTSITFKLGQGYEHLAKFVLTNASKKSSTSYFELYKGHSKEGGFVDLPLSDLTHDYNGVQITARDLFPTRSASTQNGFYQLYSASYPFVSFIERYDYNTGKWENIDVSKLAINSTVSRVYYSLAAGVDELYFLYYTNVETENGTVEKHYLSTYSESKQAWTHTVDVSDYSVYGSMIGVYDGSLILCGADYFQEEGDVSKVYKIYPDTGEVYGQLPDIPYDDLGIWGAVCGNISTYGNKLVITDSKWSVDNGVTSFFSDDEWFMYNGPIIFDGKNWSEGDWSVFDTSSSATHVDPSQNLYDAGAACGDSSGNLCDIVVGPVKNNGALNMIDTWVYNSSKDKYLLSNNDKADENSVESAQSESDINVDSPWTGLTNVRFGNFKTSTVSGAIHGNKFYVMGKCGLDYDLSFRVLDLNNLKLNSTDVATNAKHKYVEPQPGPDPQPVVPGGDTQSGTSSTGDMVINLVLLVLALVVICAGASTLAVKRHHGRTIR